MCYCKVTETNLTFHVKLDPQTYFKIEIYFVFNQISRLSSNNLKVVRVL